MSGKIEPMIYQAYTVACSPKLIWPLRHSSWSCWWLPTPVTFPSLMRSQMLPLPPATSSPPCITKSWGPHRSFACTARSPGTCLHWILCRQRKRVESSEGRQLCHGGHRHHICRKCWRRRQPIRHFIQFWIWVPSPVGLQCIYCITAATKVCIHVMKTRVINLINIYDWEYTHVSNFDGSVKRWMFFIILYNCFMSSTGWS